MKTFTLKKKKKEKNSEKHFSSASEDPEGNMRKNAHILGRRLRLLKVQTMKLNSSSEQKSEVRTSATDGDVSEGSARAAEAGGR